MSCASGCLTRTCTSRARPGPPGSRPEVESFGVTRNGRCPRRLAEVLRLAERDWPWAVSLAMALVGWASGVWFWGTPQSGFGVIAEWVPSVEAAAVAMPTMVVTGFVLGGQRWRVAAWGVWATASLAVAYVANFTHFGGICLEPGEDICVVSWLARFGAAVVMVAAVAAGWTVFRWRTRRRIS